MSSTTPKDGRGIRGPPRSLAVLVQTFAKLRKRLDEQSRSIEDDRLIIHGAVDLSSLPTWLTNSVRTLEMEGLMQHLSERSQDYALCFPNLERIIIATYVVNINLARRASPNTPDTDLLTIAQDYFNSRQSRKGKPLRMRDNAGNLMESIPERVRKIAGPTTPLPADRKHPTVEMTVYFVAGKSTPTDWYKPGFVATYNVTTGTVTSASPRFFYRNNLRDMPESTSPYKHKTKYCYGPYDEYGKFRDTVRIHNNWSNPKSWLLFRHNQIDEVIKHWEKMRRRDLDIRKAMSLCLPSENGAALAYSHVARRELRRVLNQRK